MKKFLALILVVCLVFVGVIGYLSYKDKQPAAEESDDSASQTRVIDYDALYATHDKDEVVLTIGGRDVTWGEYFYMIYTQSQQVASYFQSLAYYYGTTADWADPMEDGGTVTYADYTITSAESVLLQLASIQGFGDENGVALTEENLAAIEAQKQSDILSICGEGGSEEDFNAHLETIYMPREMYDHVNELNQLYQQNYIQLYGENGELLGDEATMQYLQDNGYISANHILLMTVDSTTGDALDEQTIAEKKATAEKLAAELKAITDPEKLVARFKELKEEYCEDSGKTSYPDGYVFTPGTMVAEFEDACNSLEEYQVSDPVESSYGFHIILRMPLDADAVIDYSDSGTALSGRSMAANAEYGQRLQAYLDKLSISYADGFEKIDLLQYVK